MADMARSDYYDDPNAPPANSLVPGGSAIVANEAGEILLHRRADNQLWSLPGGKIEIGETLAQAIIREVHEETGLRVEPERIVGIYSDPKHVIAYSDGEVRQEFSICLACRIVGGEVRVSEESSAVRFFAPARIQYLDMHPSIRLRISDYLERSEPVLRYRGSQKRLMQQAEQWRGVSVQPPRETADTSSPNCHRGAFMAPE
jgi:ADP-ribose pyrophosphatase YjhB (NUDIX family)